MPAFPIAPADSGKRIDVVLAAHSGLSRSEVQRFISDGHVSVDGRPVRKHHVVHEGETLTYEVPPAPATVLIAEDLAIPIVYEDDWLLVVDKPAGVVTHPAHGHEHGTLVQGLLQRGITGGHPRRPGIVHRLDKDTSGLLVVARTDEAYQRLVAAMAGREIHRRYVALVCGTVAQASGTIDAPMGRHLRDRKRMSLHSAQPKTAVTHFSVRERFDEHTLLDIRLETGRTHQIRVHMAAIGHPVAGDTTYGRRARPQGVTRHFLHAARLSFPHPSDGRLVECEAPLPVALEEWLVALRTPACT